MDEAKCEAFCASTASTDCMDTLGTEIGASGLKAQLKIVFLYRSGLEAEHLQRKE